jgi:hypothetical protein
MAFDYLEKRRQGKLIPRKKTLSQEVKKSIYMLIFTLLSIIILLSIVLLLNTNHEYQKGYTLKEQQIKKEDLESQNRALINQIINATIYSKIENNPLLKNMIKAEKPIYITTPKEQ